MPSSSSTSPTSQSTWSPSSPASPPHNSLRHSASFNMLNHSIPRPTPGRHSYHQRSHIPLPMSAFHHHSNGHGTSAGSLTPPQSPASSAQSPTLSYTNDPILTEDEYEDFLTSSRPHLPSPLTPSPLPPPTPIPGMTTSSPTPAVNRSLSRSSSGRKTMMASPIPSSPLSTSPKSRSSSSNHSKTPAVMERWNVMISYCWDDVNVPSSDPRRIAKCLNDAGISTWLDVEKLDPRRGVFEQLVDGILRCNNREFRLIAQLKIPFAIVFLDDVDESTWRRVARITVTPSPTTISIYDSTLTGTDNADKEIKQMPAIIAQVRSMISQSQSNITSYSQPQPTPIDSKSLPTPTSKLIPPPQPPIIPWLPGIQNLMNITFSSFPLWTVPLPSSYSHPTVTAQLNAMKTFASVSTTSATAFDHYKLGVLYTMHLTRTPATVSASLAMHHFHVAARMGFADAWFRLGVMFERGHAGVGKDLEIAKKWYRGAWKLVGKRNACPLHFWNNGGGGSNDFELDLDTDGSFESLCCCVYPDAMFAVAQIYRKDGNLSDARKLYHIAGKNGCVPAMFKMGLLYHDKLDGWERFLMDVDLGNSDGNEGVWFTGNGDIGKLIIHEEAAAMWWSKAALRGGDPMAMFNCGVLCEKGMVYSRASTFGVKDGSSGDKDKDGEYFIETLVGNGGSAEPNGSGAYTPKVDYVTAARWYERCISHSEDLLHVYSATLSSTTSASASASISPTGITPSSSTSQEEPPDITLTRKAMLNSLFNVAVFKERGLIGKGGEKDLPGAVKLYRLAAEGGHVKAMFNLGVCLKRGRGVEKDLEEGVGWFRRAAEKGHADAQFNLGNSYKYGEGIERNIKEAVQWYTRASRKGHSKAHFILGLCYEEGEGVDAADPVEAARLFKLGADAGSAISQFYYGMALERGRGVPKNLKAAVQMYKLAADQGEPDAAAALAHCYLTTPLPSSESSDGTSDSKENNDGRSSSAGSTTGSTNVSIDGPDTIAPNALLAERYLRQAAEAGDPESQFNLGCWLLSRKESLGDDSTAAAVVSRLEDGFVWVRRAARSGHSEAQYICGRCYEKGIGVSRELQKAVKWFERAVRNGYTVGRVDLER
ncbi:hypothetical protein HDU76_004050, partial [Blyttiomyces sp. JEL0837]